MLEVTFSKKTILDNNENYDQSGHKNVWLHPMLYSVLSADCQLDFFLDCAISCVRCIATVP